MFGVFVVLLVIVVIVALCCSEAKNPSSPPSKVQMRCPSCGAPVIVRGDTWECPYCTDSGRCRKKG